MTYSIEKSHENFDKYFKECLDYIKEEVDNYGASSDGVIGYLQDLNKIMSHESFDKAWQEFANSGIFHDAIGKVYDYDGDGDVLYITTEY